MAAYPVWQSHKKVSAFKISVIALADDDSGDAALIGHDGDKDFVAEVDHPYMAKHQPEVGGYYVQYEDGYASFSPAAAFEDGYTPI
jgi:hypothetical protein